MATWSVATEHFLRDVAREYTSAREANPVLHSRHEGYAVLLEEVDEVWDIVTHNGESARLYHELLQVAAMAMALAIEVV